MPKKKNSSAKKSKGVKTPAVRKPQVSSSQGASYDTLMIVTILLLVFVYPLGLAFMWIFMRTWPTWLKLVISLPLIIGIFFTVVILYIVGQAVRHVDWQKVRMEERRAERMQQRQQNMMQLTPTPASQYTF